MSVSTMEKQNALMQAIGLEEIGNQLPAVRIDGRIRPCPAVSAEMSCEDLLVLFRSRSELDCVAVCDEQERPVGILMKDRFYRQLGSLYGMSLFSHKTIGGIMVRNPLIVDKRIGPQELIDRTLSRDDDTFYDSVLVTDRERLSGMLTVSDVLHLSRHLQHDAAERQIRTVRGAETRFADIHRAIEGMAASAEDSRHRSERMDRLTERGRAELAEMLRLFRQWTEHADRQESSSGQLMERTASADQIVKLIADLADQCQLLAVNAAIEAARAGEHGRGFGVVAEQVRSLADETKRSAGQINRLLKMMAEAVADSVSLVREGKQGADAGIAQVRKSESTFDELWQSTERSRNAAERLAVSVREATDISAQVCEEFGVLIDQINASNGVER